MRLPPGDELRDSCLALVRQWEVGLDAGKVERIPKRKSLELVVPVGGVSDPAVVDLPDLLDDPAPLLFVTEGRSLQLGPHRQRLDSVRLGKPGIMQDEGAV